jgi:hypothetical protein
MRDPDFTTTDIYKIVGIGRARLKDWMDMGYVGPSVPAKGQGIAAKFTREDIYLIMFFSELISFGLKREQAATIKNIICPPEVKKPERVLAGIELVHIIQNFSDDTLSVIWTEDLRQIHKRVAADWKFITTVNFSALKKMVDKAVEKL